MTPDAIHLACTTCANSFQEAGGNAAGWAIMFLLVTIVLVLVGVGYCMIRLAKRENDALDPQFRDD